MKRHENDTNALAFAYAFTIAMGVLWSLAGFPSFLSAIFGEDMLFIAGTFPAGILLTIGGFQMKHHKRFALLPVSAGILITCTQVFPIGLVLALMLGALCWRVRLMFYPFERTQQAEQNGAADPRQR